MNLTLVPLAQPSDCNLILGQAHFIKTIEDIHELLVTSVPGIRFGAAFSEASGPCLIRHSGTDPELESLAVQNAEAVGSGHSFIIIMRGAYPINVLNALKNLQEVCTIFCATANPVQVVIAETDQGRGIMGVIDGDKPRGIETSSDQSDRKTFLRKIGYKQ
jgi:adenosine/AMP kinase